MEDIGVTVNSHLSHGTNGSPQIEFEEQTYQSQVIENENTVSNTSPPKYVPSPKHDPKHNYGSINPIKTIEGQFLLDNGYVDKKQIYNITGEGVFVKFQPDNTPGHGYHAYEVSSPRDIPSSILREMLTDGKISRTDYNKLRKCKKIIMNKILSGNKHEFAIEYSFFDNAQETQLSMFINDVNILAFKRNGKLLTTRWKLDELVLWLRDFLNNMTDDPYPVNCEGDYAAQKDEYARDFDTDNEEEFDAYYDRLEEWDNRHRWHTASSGGILADVYFQQVGDTIEISWNNADLDELVLFQTVQGVARVSKELFVLSVEKFLNDYADHWFTL